jgi:hypothetical protein
MVGKAHVGYSLTIGHQITQVSSMPVAIIASTVCLAIRIVMRSCTLASLCQITELVNVDTMIRLNTQPSH